MAEFNFALTEKNRRLSPYCASGLIKTAANKAENNSLE
jgi:hypothetical protein